MRSLRGTVRYQATFAQVELISHLIDTLATWEEG